MVVNAIIQARCNSTRFPNKVFAEIDGKPLIWHVVNRLTYAKTINRIIIATTNNSKDDAIQKWCEKNDIACFRGNETDVLNRYYLAASEFQSDVVVRITADDPFKEPALIDAVVNKLISEGYDHVTNNFPPSWPEGLDCEAFTFDALEKSEKATHDEFEREHVTQYIYHNPDKFKIGNVMSPEDLSFLRWTIDKQMDYEMVKSIYAHRNPENRGILLLDEILDILEKYPEIKKINASIERSAMYNIKNSN
ncbi:MAG: glycosyltransferase family protein [Bacteroidales bacterium]|nr:glycosyltransferase family protein [Bacteroidales bacterium]